MAINLVKIIKKADYYHLLGSDLRAEKTIDEIASPDAWVKRFKTIMKEFYQGINMTKKDTQNLVNGVEKINNSINDFDKLLEEDWNKESCVLKNLLTSTQLKDERKDKKLKEAIEATELSAKQSPETPNNTKSLDIFLLLLSLKNIAVLDIIGIRKKYLNRIRESLELTPLEKERKIKEIFSSILDDLDKKGKDDLSKEKEEEIAEEAIKKRLEKAKGVFTIGILGVEKGLFKEDYIEITSYIRRGFAFYLQSFYSQRKYYEQAFNDYTVV